VGRSNIDRLNGGEGTILAQGLGSEQTKSLSSVAAVVQSIGAKFFMLAINAATGILSARALQPTGRGELAAMILWPIFLAGTLTLGLPSALTFQLKSNPEKRSQLVGAALLLTSLSGAMGAIAGLLLMHALIPQYSHRVILFARIFLLNTPLVALMLTGRAALESRGDFAASNKLLIVPPALTLLSLAILWRTETLTPFSAGLAYVPAGIPPFLWMMRRLSQAFRPSLRSFVDSARLLFTYGIRAYGIDLCGTMSLYIDQALVVRMLQPEMMGTYVVALTFSRMLNTFHASVVMVLFPRAVSSSPEAVREMTSRAARMSTLFTAFAAAAVTCFGPYLLVLAYGKEYVGAATVLRILVLEAVLSGATLVLSQAFMALERPGVITALQVTGLILTLPLMLVFVPRLGIVGAGLALLLSTTARLLFVLASYPIFLKMRMPRVFPRAEDLKFMVGAVSKTVTLSRGKPWITAEGAD
jgi:O-antigen/teichoic acid export membrane protein